jgi:hypothetical protein
VFRAERSEDMFLSERSRSVGYPEITFYYHTLPFDFAAKACGSAQGEY